MTAQNGNGTGTADPVAGIIDQLATQLQALDEREEELHGQITLIHEEGKRMRAALRSLDPDHPRSHPPGWKESRKASKSKAPSDGKEYPVKAESLERVWLWVRD